MNKVSNEAIKELESFDPSELVEVLEISSDRIISAFYEDAQEYVKQNFSMMREDDGEEEEISDLDGFIEAFVFDETGASETEESAQGREPDRYDD